MSTISAHEHIWITICYSCLCQASVHANETHRKICILVQTRMQSVVHAKQRYTCPVHVNHDTHSSKLTCYAYTASDFPMRYTCNTMAPLWQAHSHWLGWSGFNLTTSERWSSRFIICSYVEWKLILKHLLSIPILSASRLDSSQNRDNKCLRINFHTYV